MLCYVRLLLNLSSGPVFYVFNPYSYRSASSAFASDFVTRGLLFLSNVSFRSDSEYTSIIGLRQLRSFSDVSKCFSISAPILSNIRPNFGWCISDSKSL